MRNILGLAANGVGFISIILVGAFSLSFVAMSGVRLSLYLFPLH